MRFIGGTAKRILHEDDPEAPIDRAEHRAENANVCFAAGEGFNAAAAQRQM